MRMRLSALEQRTVLLVALAGGAAVLAGVGSAPLAAQGRGRLAPAQSPAGSVQLSGAGSTFDAPFFDAAFPIYHQLHPSVSVTYAAVGSSLGIKRFSAGSVDFGASDVPMTAAEQSAAQGGPVVQVPVVLGGVVLAYNLDDPEISTGLHLSGPVIANIYLGGINNWDDPAIAALNPGLSLPNLPIVPVHRMDGSGTTYIFTNFLSTVSEPWANGPGTNKSISWPVGIAGKGNEGVYPLIARVPGAIGYLELSYAASHELPTASVENRAGHFVYPTFTAIADAAAMKPQISSTDFSIVNQPGANSYPIVGYSWMLLSEHQRSAAVGGALANLGEWLSHSGQAAAAANSYVPLPANIRALAQRTVERLVGPSGERLLGS